MHPRSISIKDYSYILPEEKIATHPLAARDASRLLVYKSGRLQESVYSRIDSCLPPDSLLVFNNTSVVAARLLFQKPSGGIIEIFCLEPAAIYPDIHTGMQQQGAVLWKCLIGGAGKWKAGQVLERKINSGDRNIVLSAKYIEKQKDCFVIELSWTPDGISFAELLQLAGQIPLPPYIKRNPDAADKERYQTIYAEADGSVAAPTAGLHFTPSIFEKLNQRNIQQDFVTLHVGAGTFKPVKADQMQDHLMHAEFIAVTKVSIQRLCQRNVKNVFAVGTTSLRTLESLYWMGVKTLLHPEIHPAELVLSQWEVYEGDLNRNNFSATQALEGLVHWMDRQQLPELLTKTQILIVPGYSFKIISGLITNFHQPQSTLLLLVAALMGEDWKKMYAYALAHEFRFLSYGDGCLIFGAHPNV